MSTLSSAPEELRLPRIATPAPSQFLSARNATRWPTRILVCADDSQSAGDAIAAAKGLAKRSNAEVKLVSIFSPRISFPREREKEGSARCEECDRSAAATLIRSVRKQQRRHFDGHVAWPVDLEVGNVVSSIIESAKRSRPDLIVLGLGSRAPILRQQGPATPVSVARYCEMPMLAATALPAALPQEGVLLLDSDTPDMGLIRAALHCLEDAAVLWLLMHGSGSPRAAGGVRHDQATISRMVRAVREEAREISKRIVVRAVYRAGDAVEAALTVAREVNADLIAVPVHGAAGCVRAFVPNVADRLLLSATCSVLVVPENCSIER